MKRNTNRRTFIKYIGAGAAALMLTNPPAIVSAAGSPQKKPNIILILTDDQGWTDTSVQMMKNRPDSKSDFYQTPNLEQMAKEGMIFSNAYSPAPVCCPTRNSIQHGKTPARLHYTTLASKAVPSLNGAAIPKMIKAVDPSYVTAHFGKWHISNLTPEQAGYDKSDGPTGNGEGDVEGDDPKLTFSLSRRACDFMKDQVKADRPFYMQVSYYAAHVQNYALEKTKEKYRKMKPGKKCTAKDFMTPPPPLNAGIVDYAAMIEDLDTGFGMILNKLDGLGITDNTYVIFIGDNGGGFRGNEPLARGKADLWEGGIRVPMVVRGPAIPAGTYCDVPVAGWDFYPTFSDLIGNKNPLSDGIDGASLRNVFEKGNRGKVERGEEALIFHFPWFEGEPESAIRLGDYKLIKNLDTRKLWLFNLADDIEESKNLANSMPEKTKELHDKLTAYLKSVDAEDVQSLRKNRRRSTAKSIPQLEKRIKELKAKLKAENKIESKELARAEKHLRFLKEQIIFIDERSLLHNTTAP